LKQVSARVLSYSVVASLAAIAIWQTPTLEKRPVVLLQPVLVSQPGMESADYTLNPLYVQAFTHEKLDTLAIAGVIQSSLYSALDKTGIDDLPRNARHALAGDLADIFEYRVDMTRDLSQGDRFHILVERLQKPNGKIIVNRVLGARLALGGGINELEAIHFQSRGSNAEYFDQSGKSLRTAFLRTPVTFRRISSVFGLRRHPIFGNPRAHKGTDYAAAMGTPVRSVGDGVVIFAGRKGGYGNAIDVRHRNGFVSRYGHMRNFAKEIRRGTRVTMGSTIGFVGMTGYATGPHLHFEVLVGGVQRDPRQALASNSGDPIPAGERKLFQRLRTQTLAGLSQARVASAAPITD